MKNQKWMAVLIAAGLCAGAVAFAQDYTVSSVTGKVTVMGNGGWKPLSPGSVLSESSQVNVGLNSRLVVSDGGEENVIPQMKRGELGKLMGKSPSEPKSPSRHEVAAETTGSRRAVQTAASRADDMDEEDDWED